MNLQILNLDEGDKMSEKETLKTVEKSIMDYCQKQMVRSSIKIFNAVIDNDEESRIVVTGIDSVLALIKKAFDYEIPAYSIQVIDPDDRKAIISLMQNTGHQWEITQNVEAE